MAKLSFIPFAAAATAAWLVPGPAEAGITVLGASNARMCYEASESPLMPRAQDVSACDQAIATEQLSPRDLAATYTNRGILRLRLTQLDAAMADFDRSLAIDPSHPDTYINRGSALILQEQAEPAIAMFDEALQRRTRRPELAYYGRGMANEALGRVSAAYEDYRRASALAPGWRQPRRELARFQVVRQ